MSKNVYIASSPKDGGIYRYTLNVDGTLTFCEKFDIQSPMYMEINGDKMYIVGDDRPSSYATYCTINPDGTLIDAMEMMSTEGKAGCHITVLDDNIYVANYSSGSLIKFNSDGTSKLVVHEGSGPNKSRQEMPHVHHVIFTPDKKYLCATDLGIDAIVMYDRDLNYIGQADIPAGHGPRHITFSPCGKYAYCVNEVENTVTTLEYDGEQLIVRNTYSILPKDYNDGGTAAAIRITQDGEYLYASNRGHNSIACCKVNGTELDVFEIVSCGGDWPRDINLTPDDKFLYCTNEHSDTVTIFKRDEVTGKIEQLEQIVNIPAPLCVVFN